MLSGFKQFILRGNVVDLAVGVIIGASFGTVVSALVKDIITPLIGVVGGKPNFSTFSVSLNHSTFLLGDFINAVISFLIIAAVVYYFVVLPINKLVTSVKKGKTIEPDTKKCPECLSLIPVLANRCAFCTSHLHKSAKK